MKIMWHNNLYLNLQGIQQILVSISHQKVPAFNILMSLINLSFISYFEKKPEFPLI
jgi:hypothetical protein